MSDDTELKTGKTINKDVKSPDAGKIVATTEWYEELTPRQLQLAQQIKSDELRLVWWWLGASFYRKPYELNKVPVFSGKNKGGVYRTEFPEAYLNRVKKTDEAIFDMAMVVYPTEYGMAAQGFRWTFIPFLNKALNADCSGENGVWKWTVSEGGTKRIVGDGIHASFTLSKPHQALFKFLFHSKEQELFSPRNPPPNLLQYREEVEEGALFGFDNGNGVEIPQDAIDMWMLENRTERVYV